MSWNQLRKGRYSHSQYYYFVTCTTTERTPLFFNSKCAQILIDNINTLEQEGEVQWLSWVIMPDHFHGLLVLESDELSKTMKLLKGRSSVLINRLLKRRQSTWQPGFYDHALRKDEAIKPIIEYIVFNPVRRGLVNHPKDWFWSKGCDLLGL